MAEVGRGLRASWGPAALWLMPCTVIFEWVGGTFYKPLPVRVAYLGLFLALYWSHQPLREPDRPWASARRWGLGVSALLLGLACFGCASWWLLGPRLGWPPFRPPESLANEASRLLLPLVAAWPLAVGCALCREGTLGPRAYQRLGAFLALGFGLHFVTQVRVQGLPVSLPADPWLIFFACVLLALALVTRGPFAVRLAVLLALGFGLRALGLWSWQIDPGVRDMLALVQSAQDRFVSGHDPYALYAMQHGSVLPLTYLPGLWLGYGLPRLFGLDLRWFGPCAEVLMFVALARTAGRVEPARRAWAQAIVFCFAALWFFSPSVQWNAIYAEPTWWWSLLGMTLLFSFAGPYWLGALLLGLAVATRHFAIVLAPFVLLYFVRVRGLRGSLPLVAICAGTAALLLFPFAVGQPELFWFGTFRWLREYGPAHIQWFIDRFGFLEWFVQHDALGLLPYAQAGLVGACLLAASLVKRPTWIASFAASASLLFIMFNVLIWDSFLLDGAVAAAALLVSAPLRAHEQVARMQPAPRAVYLSLAVITLSALAAGYLAFTLVGTLRPAGYQASHDFMRAEVKPGDFVIDRSARRIAFVEGGWLLRKDEVPAPIGGDFYDGAWRGEAALVAPGKVWLVTEAGRDQAMRVSFARLGKRHVERAFGDYRVQAIVAQPPRPVPVPQGRKRRCGLGWSERELPAVLLRKGAPVTLRFPRAGTTLLLAVGFPNELVSWPHRPASAHVVGAAPFLIENLPGMQFSAFDGLRGDSVTVVLETDDPVSRELCLEPAWSGP
jgi:hypothetical protein